MAHSKHKKHNQKDHDDISDIIPMSNDDSINKKHKLNKHDDDEPTDDEYDDYDSDDEYDDPTDDEDDDDEVYERKGHSHAEDKEYKAPNIKAKRAKPHRGTEFTNQEISELKRDKGVKQLSDKLNSNLHQIQIAIPYGQQDPQTYPGMNQPMGYQYTEQMKPKKVIPFWRRRLFKLTMKTIIAVCVFIICGVFLYKYLKAIEEIKRLNNDIFNDENRLRNNVMNNYDIADQDVISDKTYNSFGNVTRANTIKGGTTAKNIKRCLPPRDARGRFLKMK